MFSPNDPLFRRVRAHAAGKIRFEGEIPDRALRSKAYRAFYNLERQMILRYHRQGDSGLKVAQAGAVLIDVLLEELFRTANHLLRGEFRRPFPFAVIALGGYGRGEMSPYSDVDILLLYGNAAESKTLLAFQSRVCEEMLYPLWDLGLKVGHASRSIKQALLEAKSEPQSKNALLEARFLLGDAAIFERFMRQFSATWRKGAALLTIETQIAEQKKRRQKYGDSIYMQEPDIKNGAGGLRDYQNVLWMSRIRFGEASLSPLIKHGVLSAARSKRFLESYEFLLRARNELHFQADRPTDTLDLERQPKVAWHLGYRERDIFARVERFMREYYQHAKNIFRVALLVEYRLLHRDMPNSRDRISLREVIASRRQSPEKRFDGFRLIDGIIDAQSKDVFQEDPARLVRIFRYAQQYGAKIDFDLQAVVEEENFLLCPNTPAMESAERSLLAILGEVGQVYPALERMHALGVLGRVIPDFGRLTCLVQHEYFHRYTADIHTLSCLRNLDEIFNEESRAHARYLRALRLTGSSWLLYLILLLHDIGKADGIQGHDKRGVDLAGPILDRFRVFGEERRQILDTIANHLEMARFWQRFDLDDPETTQAFAGLVGGANRLRHLYVHTYCDARATAESLWSDYKQMLHDTLYLNTESYFRDLGRKEPVMSPRDRFSSGDISQRVAEVSRDEIEAHLNLLPERYFAHSNQEDVELHIRMVNQLLSRIQGADSLGALVPVVDWQNEIDQGFTVVNVVTWDRAGLFYKLAGALSVAGVNILSTKAMSRADHIAIDTFYVVDPGGGIVQDQKAQVNFEEHVRLALIEDEDLLPFIEKQAERSRNRLFRPSGQRLRAPVHPSVNVYHELSLNKTIIEVEAEDEIGLLYRLSKVIFECGFDITFARISTENGIANDTFYIESATEGGGIENENLLDLRQRLGETVAVRV